MQSTHRYIAIIFLLLFANCARKAPPPSPDRRPPYLLYTRVIDIGSIEIGFDENVVGPESIRIESLAGIESLPVLAFTVAGRKIVVSTADMDTLKYRMTLNNLGDLAGNMREVYQTEFRGRLSKDTTPPLPLNGPRLSRNLPEDTTLTLRFAEWVEGCFIYIMPPLNKEYEWNRTRTEIRLHISGLDTRTVYNFYGKFWDRAKNLSEVRFVLTRERETPLLWVNGTVEERTFLLLTREGIPKQFLVSDTLFLFQNLYPDNYTLLGKREDNYFSSGSFKLSLPREGVKLSPVAEQDIDSKLVGIMDSLYVWIRRFKD